MALPVSISTRSLSPPIRVSAKSLETPLNQVITKICTIVGSVLAPNSIHISRIEEEQVKIQRVEQLFVKCADLFPIDEEPVEVEPSSLDELRQEITEINLSLFLLDNGSDAFELQQLFAKKLRGVAKVCNYLALTMQNFRWFHKDGKGFERLQKFSLPPFSKAFFQETIKGMKIKRQTRLNKDSHVYLVETTSGFKYVEKRCRFQNSSTCQTEGGLLAATGAEERVVQLACVMIINFKKPTYVLKPYPKDLYDFVREGLVTRKNFPQIMSDILEALAFLHENNVVHADLKLENVFLESKDGIERAVIADVELAQKFGVIANRGTKDYLPPEVERDTTSDKRDIWALGALAFEILTDLDFDASEFSACLDLLPAIDRCRELDPDCFWKRFILRCLSINPLHRPSAVELLALVKNEMQILATASVN